MIKLFTYGTFFAVAYMFIGPAFLVVAAGGLMLGAGRAHAGRRAGLDETGLTAIPALDCRFS